MRRLVVIGAIVAGMLVAGCAAQGKEHASAWKSIVSQDFASARAKYESILAGDPGNPYANLNIGVAYEELGDNAMAAKHYEAAIASGAEAAIHEVAQDGNVAGRNTTVKQVAQENLARIRG